MIDIEARKKIGKELKKYRVRKRWTQDDLANTLKCSKSYISGLERGTKNLNSDLLSVLSKLMDIPSDVLLGINRTYDSEYINEIEVYRLKGTVMKDVFKNGKVYHKERIVEKGVGKTYKIDNGIENAESTNLYAIELDQYSDILKAPAGSMVIIEHSNIFYPTLDSVYVLMTFEYGIAPSDDPLDKMLGSTAPNTFITKIVPMMNMNTKVQALTAKKTPFYKFIDPNGVELYGDSKFFRYNVIGIVKKVIIDY